MLISSDAEKPELLKFLWCLYEQMQKNIYYWSLSDLNNIRCWKTGIIELCLMLTSSDAVKRDIMEFCLMLISSNAENRCHWIFSDVNIIRCRKTDIIEFWHYFHVKKLYPKNAINHTTNSIVAECSASIFGNCDTSCSRRQVSVHVVARQFSKYSI